MKILVVDDNPTILLTTAHLLGKMHTAITADGLQEAKDALAHDEFDLVISDLSLSGRQGTEGLELLSYIKETSCNTEVIIMTGFGSDRIREDAYNKGALFYFEKPILIEDLLSMVQEAAVRMVPS